MSLRNLGPLAALLLTACGDKDGDTGASAPDACELAAEYEVCAACTNGDVTCEYGDYSETADSCGDCQARGALYSALCDAGVTDARDTITADTSCDYP
jgi:hypothetical protein